MTFEKVLDGAVRFINENVIPGMNDWQEIAARIAIGRLYENQQSVLTFLQNNGIIYISFDHSENKVKIIDKVRNK